jgi:hypothetical protein
VMRSLIEPASGSLRVKYVVRDRPRGKSRSARRARLGHRRHRQNVQGSAIN